MARRNVETGKKKSVYKTETIRKTIQVKPGERYLATLKRPDGTIYSHSWHSTYEEADVEGELEVILDVGMLIAQYAGHAFRNKQKRFKRGPITVHVRNMKQVSENRHVDTGEKFGYSKANPTKVSQPE